MFVTCCRAPRYSADEGRKKEIIGTVRRRRHRERSTSSGITTIRAGRVAKANAVAKALHDGELPTTRGVAHSGRPLGQLRRSLKRIESERWAGTELRWNALSALNGVSTCPLQHQQPADGITSIKKRKTIERIAR